MARHAYVRRVARAACAAAALVLALVARAPRAAAAPRTPALLVVEGARRGERVRDALRDALADRYAVLAAGDGVLAPGTSDALAEPAGDALAARVGAVARELGADEVLVVRLPERRGPRVARVVVVDARGEAPPLRAEVALGARASAAGDAARIRAVIGEPLHAADDAGDEASAAATLSAATVETGSAALGATPPPAAPASAAPAAPRAAPLDAPLDALASRPARARDDVTRALVSVAPRVGLGERHFDYRDRVTAGLRSYALGGAPRVAIAAEAYPLAARGGFWSAVGLSAEYASAVGLDSSRSDGARLDTSWTSFDVALRVRARLAPRVTVAGHAGYGGVDFGFAADPAAIADADASLPAVSYRFVRVGADARLAVWRLAVLAGLDGLAVTGNGPLDARFPREKIGGIEARVGVAVPLAPHVEARTGLVYQRFFYDLRPQPNDANVAGGALDELAWWDVSAAFFY